MESSGSSLSSPLSPSGLGENVRQLIEQLQEANQTATNSFSTVFDQYQDAIQKARKSMDNASEINNTYKISLERLRAEKAELEVLEEEHVAAPSPITVAKLEDQKSKVVRYNRRSDLYEEDVVQAGKKLSRRLETLMNAAKDLETAGEEKERAGKELQEAENQLKNAAPRQTAAEEKTEPMDKMEKMLEEHGDDGNGWNTDAGHFIVPTGKDGVFESDDFAFIICVFLPTMLMKSQWLGACLQKKSNLRDDYKFRVEKVKYKGVIYDTVLKWFEWMHKSMLPFLHGVQFHLAIQGFGEGESSMLRSLVEMHGAVWCEEMPVKEQYNIGSHPFHHFDLGPLFVIHDGKTDLDHLTNDSDKMYTLLSFDQFIAFMLKMDVTYDPQCELPIPVSNREDSTA